MPFAAKRPCTYPGCGTLTDHGRCERHLRPEQLHLDQFRGSAAKRGYGRRWRATSKGFLRAHPFCQCADCDEGRKALTPATVVDHVIPHRGNMAVFWDPLNWQAMAKRCHDRKRWRESIVGDNDRMFQELRMPSDLAASRIPCIIVCGPPGGGKSSYVREHAGLRDIVIDLDKIMQGLSGLPEHQTNRRWLPQALAERNRQLRALASDAMHERAWFIIAAPNKIERALWAQRLGATVKVLAPPFSECIRRIKADATRDGHIKRMTIAVLDWWKKNDQQEG